MSGYMTSTMGNNRTTVQTLPSSPLSSVTNMRAFQILLDAGANINLRSKSGITPLLDAAVNFSVDMVELLLNSGD